MQSWDRRTSHSFIWGRTVFASPLGSMKRNKQGVWLPPCTPTCRQVHAFTYTSRHTYWNMLQSMGSLTERPVYFGCKFWCPAGTWDGWTGRAVQQTADTHSARHDEPGWIVCQLQATKTGKGERAGQSVSKCVWEEKNSKSGQRREGCSCLKGWYSTGRGTKVVLICRKK